MNRAIPSNIKYTTQKTAKVFLQHLLISTVLSNGIALIYIFAMSKWNAINQCWFELALANYMAFMLAMLADILIPWLRNPNKKLIDLYRVTNNALKTLNSKAESASDFSAHLILYYLAFLLVFIILSTLLGIPLFKDTFLLELSLCTAYYASLLFTAIYSLYIPYAIEKLEREE